MFEQEDGTLVTLASPPPQPQNVVTGKSVWGDDWDPLNFGGSVANGSGLSYPPVWQAIRQISGDGATLDCVEYSIDDSETLTPAKSEPGYRLMMEAPNQVQTPSVFKETMFEHALWWGNGRAAILRDGTGRPAELIPLLPDRTWTFLLDIGGTSQKFHHTNVYPNRFQREQGRQQFIDPTDTDTAVVIRDEDVFHFPGLGYDGISGYDVARLFRRTIDIGISADSKIVVTFKKQGVPPLMLTAPPGVFKTESEAVDFLRNFNLYHAGVMNSGKAGLLRNGITASQLTASNRDEQFEELKRLTRQDVASIFNMPIHMLGDTSAATLNNVEQMYRNYENRTLRYWLVRWAQEAWRKLLTRQQQASQRFIFEWDTTPLTMATLADRSKFYDSMRKNNAMNGLDIRRRENMPPVDDPAAATYANPNTSAPTEAIETPDQDQPTAAELIKIRCRELAKVEVDRLAEASDCVRADTFVRRVDKQMGMHSRVLETAIGNCGGDVSRVSKYCSDRKGVILERMTTTGNHENVVDDVNDVSEHIYRTFFGGNGKP